MTECSVPTLHSNKYKYKGPSLKEEVLLAAMDANINALKKGDEDLPELHKKWVEAAADTLMGAPPHLPPLWEINHKIESTVLFLLQDAGSCQIAIVYKSWQQ